MFDLKSDAPKDSVKPGQHDYRNLRIETYSGAFFLPSEADARGHFISTGATCKILAIPVDELFCLVDGGVLDVIFLRKGHYPMFDESQVRDLATSKTFAHPLSRTGLTLKARRIRRAIVAATYRWRT